MNNENNNLNGVVLGNVSNDNPVNNNPQNINEGMSLNQAINQSVNPTPVNNPGQVMQGNTVQEGSQIVQPEVQQPNPQVMSAPQPEVVNPQVQNQTVMPNNNPEPTPQVQPAYTSISQINPNSNNMPGQSNNIGTTPPISLDQEPAPKKKENKTAFIIIIVALILAVAGGTFYVLNYTDLLNKKETINLTVNNLMFNANEELPSDLSNYAIVSGTSISNCRLDLSNVDNTKTGIYKYSVTCSNVTKEGNITIVEAAEEEIVTNMLYIKKGSNLSAIDFIDNPKEDYKYEFEDVDAVDKILNGDYGEYTINILVTDSNDKQRTIDAKLVLLEYNIKGYTICTIEDINNNLTTSTSYSFAIFDDGNNSYANMAKKTISYKYSNEEDYNKIKEDSEKNKEITVNGVKGIPVFDDDNLTFVIISKLDENTANKEFGKENLKNYSTIRSYFKDSLGYSCVYQKANTND